MPDRSRLHSWLVILALVLAAASGGGTYTVEQGDSLWRIAQRFGTSVVALAEANGIADPSLIHPGQSLLIPGEAAATHLVRPGETLAAIAGEHGLSVQVIAEANGITNTNRIYAGTQLRLSAPPVATSPTPAPAERRIHLVSAGETLLGIALQYGTTVGRIVEANGIADPDLIVAGKALSVPGGGFVCPISGAEFFNDWGFARTGGRFHEGNDLFAPSGTPVLAPVGGTVQQLEGPIGGLQFRLISADGTTYVGTHLSSFGAGGEVSAGQVIGHVGDSGNARGSRTHLHFEMIPAGSPPVNPYPALSQACG